MGIGLHLDGFSSSLDLMRTIGTLWFGEEPSGVPSEDPDGFYFQGSDDAETSPPCGASLWLGVEDFLGLTALL